MKYRTPVGNADTYDEASRKCEAAGVPLSDIQPIAPDDEPRPVPVPQPWADQFEIMEGQER